MLLLTATPLQLQRHELFSLVEMLNPILFSSEDEFNHHIGELAGLNRLVEQLEQQALPEGSKRVELANDAARLLRISDFDSDCLLADKSQLADQLRSRHKLSEVLIRNRRSVVGGFMPRKAFRWEVELTQEEKDVQDLMDLIISEGFEKAEVARKNAVGFLMTTWQKLAVSSSRALLMSLRKRRQRLAESPTRTDVSTEEGKEALEEDIPVAIVIGKTGRAVNENEIEHLEVAIDLLELIPIDSKSKCFRRSTPRTVRRKPKRKSAGFYRISRISSNARISRRGCGVGMQPISWAALRDCKRRGGGPVPRRTRCAGHDFNGSWRRRSKLSIRAHYCQLRPPLEPNEG